MGRGGYCITWRRCRQGVLDVELPPLTIKYFTIDSLEEDFNYQEAYQ